MLMKSSVTTRRGFLQQAGTAAVAWTAGSRLASSLPAMLPSPVGCSIISWQADDFAQALETISALGYQGVQLLGWVQEAYAGNKAVELKNRLQKLKLSAAALSCGKVSLRPDSSKDFAAEFRECADFLHILNGDVLQLIDGAKPRGNYSASQIKSMGATMNEMGKIAKDSGMTVAYHPHFWRLGETREGLGRVLDATDPRYVGLIADVAHLTMGGSDPAEVIRTYRERLVMLHFKDVRREAFELARHNPDAVKGLKTHFCEIGTGVVNFPAITASLREVQFKGWIIVELDSYAQPAGGPAESARTNRDAIRTMGFNV